MGTQQKADGAAGAQETGVALSVTQQDMANLSPEARQAITDRKMANLVMAKIAATNWGKGMDVETRRAIADWGARHGVDVTTEIHVLGGNLYLNAQFYINRLIKLMEAGKILEARPDLVMADPRLNPERPSDAAELERRRTQRITHGIPENAAAACVFRIRLRSMPHNEFTGAKWCGGGSRKDDPVGDKFPVETAITRSARRCMKFVATYMPDLAQYIQGADEDAKVSLGEVLEEHHQREKLARAEAAEAGRVTPLPAGDAYGFPALPSGAPPELAAGVTALAEANRKATSDAAAEAIGLPADGAADESAGQAIPSAQGPVQEPVQDEEFVDLESMTEEEIVEMEQRTGRKYPRPA